MINHVILDLDDTLIACGKYYLAYKRTFAQAASVRTGLPESVCFAILQAIDLECTHLPDGWGRERFPKSFAAASLSLDVIAGIPVDTTASEQAYLLGESVFTAPYEVLPHTHTVLNELVQQGKTLYLYTKGDFTIQQTKINAHGLDQYIAKDRMYIVPAKSGDALRQIVQDHALDIKTCVMVGDSTRDDIGSAWDIGMRSILVQTGYAWAYETRSIPPTRIIPDLSHLTVVLSDMQLPDTTMYTTNRSTP